MSNAIVIIPTYKERDNIRAIIDTVFGLPKDFDILIVDDEPNIRDTIGVTMRREGFEMQVSRPDIVTKEVDKLLQNTSIAAPEDVMWFSMMDPTLGVLGLARQTASGGTAQQVQLTEEQKSEEQRLADVRGAINSRTKKITDFIGNSTSKTARACPAPSPRSVRSWPP